MRTFILSTVLALSLSACAIAGSGKINWDNARQVKEGMSQQEVKALLGQPYMVKSEASAEKWIWVNANAWGGAESIALPFRDGKVIEALRIPDSFGK